MSKQINNSRENQELFLEALEVYKEKIESLNKRASLKSGAESSSLFDVIKKMVDIQNSSENNMVTRSDLTDSEYARIASYAKHRKLSVDEVLNLMAENLRYVPRGASFDFVSRLNQAMQDIVSVFEEYYRKGERNLFPKNVLSEENYNFLRNLNTGLSIDKNIELILRVFRPELLNEEEQFNVTERAIRLSRDKAKLKEYASAIREKFADENGNIDSIFAEENEKFLVDLLRNLESEWVDFEEFVKRFVSQPGKQYYYTHCYTADSTKIGPKLVDYYTKTYKTTKAMQDVDPYLASKLRSAMDALNIHEIGKLIKYWQRPSDNEKPTTLFNEYDLDMHENELKRVITSRYGGVVPEKLKTIDRKTYDILCLLAKRHGFKTNDEYISSIGLERKQPTSIGTNKGVNFFTDYDLVYYKIFDEAETEEDVSELMRYMGIKLYEVNEKHIKTYRNYAYNGQDSRSKNNNLSELKQFGSSD